MSGRTTLPSKRKRKFGSALKPGLNATTAPTVIDIAWAAGIYEGEGSAVPSGSNNRSTLASVCQKDDWLLLKLKAMFGGSIYYRKCKIPVWCVYGPRARAFLLTIFTYLSPRRRAQVRIALGPKAVVEA